MRSLRFVIRLLLWSLVPLGSPAEVQADFIIGNLSSGDGGNVMLNSSNYAAGSFTIGNQPYLLSDVQVRLTGGVPEGITFQLRGDAGGQPSDSILFTFSRSDISGLATKTYIFPANSPFTLPVGATFWLVGFTSSSSARWVDSDPPINPLGTAAMFGQYKSSSDGGESWISTLDQPKFQLDGLPIIVPELSSMILLVIGLSMLVALRRRWPSISGSNQE